MLKRIINIFSIKREERLPALIALMYFVALNALNVTRYWAEFSKVLDGGYHSLFVKGYRLSGFDPLTYEVLSQWFPAYDVHRHPMLAFFMYPINQINQGLMILTGTNFATVLTAVITTFCAFYSYIFLYRILKDIIGVSQKSAMALTGMYFTMGFVMLASMAPDHFVLSQFCLLLTIYVSFYPACEGLSLWKTIALFVLTAGVSLNNGLKVFWAAFMTRGKRFFQWRFLLFACLLPSALMWGVARWEYKTWRLPREKARAEMKAKKNKEMLERMRSNITDTIKDTSKVEAVLKAEHKRIAHRKYVRDHQSGYHKNSGKPLANGEFSRWTDITTDRWSTTKDNLFGEAIQLHHGPHAMKDVLRDRPLFVSYEVPWAYINYSIEALLVLLFIIGIWYGKRSRLLWTALGMFLMDMTLHMGFGFGINEIYIMSAHYLFAMPIAMAFLLKKTEEKRHLSWISWGIATIALWLLIWNCSVILTSN